jgi:P-type Ca2+ transporter type 2C
MDLTEAPESDLVFIGIVGIQDPVRPEVPDAVKACQRAGIRVRMVTGDSTWRWCTALARPLRDCTGTHLGSDWRGWPDVVTARNIARQCGILSKGGIVMEGSEFRRLTPDQVTAHTPARCSDGQRPRSVSYPWYPPRQMDRLVPNLEVLARSSPTDKQLLVGRCVHAMTRREASAIATDAVGHTRAGSRCAATRWR